MATMIAILLLICCCFCKKCTFLRRSLDDDCCGMICIRQTVINQRAVKSSGENVTDALTRRLAVTVCDRSQLLQAWRWRNWIRFQWEALTQRWIRLINVDGRIMCYVFVVWSIYMCVGNISTCFCKCFHLRGGGVAKACPTPVVLWLLSLMSGVMPSTKIYRISKGQPAST
jgi:hypothetical protein